MIYDWRFASAQGLDARGSPAAPRLGFVQQPSVGVPAHDVDALDAAGVPLANAAGFNTVAVAEWVLGALFGVARHFHWVEDELRAGRWPQVDVIARGPMEIGGRRVGIVGFGPVAQASWPVCRRSGARCRTGRGRVARRPTSTARRTVTLDELIAASDVLINVIALGDETRGLLSAARLAVAAAGALVVSASRGGIVDEQAVLEAVERATSPARRSTSTRPNRCRGQPAARAATGSC